ncbi:calcium uniporter protein 4, mitochondrial [Diospyros lotus]|uniref:calcium uniporter protein 4, mitochondrial n=1 Tax=Diospyros lotus TaxID=55363 RepID=UPI002255A1F1|nr:calcium uniporter protein 4, mitochondrial [Diospyros lotus]
MALRRTLARRLFGKTRDSSPLATLDLSPISSPSSPKTLTPPNAATTNFRGEFLLTPQDSGAATGFFRRFLQRRAINQAAARLPEFLSIPIGDKLKEKLINVAGDQRLRLDGLSPPPPPPPLAISSSGPSGWFGCGVSVQEAKKILRSSQLEKLRSELRKIPVNSISYTEYVEKCVDVCSSREQGLEFAKNLDESGNVIVLGNVVFIRPDQLAKSMEKIFLESVARPDDPRRTELEEMQRQKTAIDKKAQQLVQGELYCGLGFLVAQTLGFMRLTFWELSWDVMEPICFFVTSLHFALAYAFFLRTSKEPSFEGYFQRRFRVKQAKLFKTHNFDLNRYHDLTRIFYPERHNAAPASAPNSAGEVVLDAVHG